jgi:hypothetical protein
MTGKRRPRDPRRLVTAFLSDLVADPQADMKDRRGPRSFGQDFARGADMRPSPIEIGWISGGRAVSRMIGWGQPVSRNTPVSATVRGAAGGAGSGKSVDTAQMYILRLLTQTGRNLLCVRKTRNQRQRPLPSCGPAVRRMGVEDCGSAV